MTTEHDLGSAEVERLPTPMRDSNLYPTLVLALRDMRKACGRNEDDGHGVGNDSWIGLSLGMIVLDTLSGEDEDVRPRWIELLTRHRISSEDADLIYAFRCSLLHGYGLPKPGKVGNRRVILHDEPNAFAVDTSRDGDVIISIPVFCGHLVERIAAEAPDDWDVASVATNMPLS